MIIRDSDNKEPRTGRTTLTSKHRPMQRLTLEDEIDTPVYQLYILTEDEIAMVAGKE